MPASEPGSVVAVAARPGDDGSRKDKTPLAGRFAWTGRQDRLPRDPGEPHPLRTGESCGQKLAVTRAYQKAPLKPNGEVSAYLTPRYCNVAFCSLPG